MDAQDIINNSDFNTGANQGPTQRIKVIGVGGGGNNAVNHMFKQGIKDVSFVLINTDRQALDQSSIPTKLVIGPGRGAGGKPEKARQFAEDNCEKIMELFDDNTDMVFVTAGMGGGTGTGAAPVVARIAKELGILTVGIVTIPFLFEGKQKVLKALDGAKEMQKNVDALLIINNERLTEIYKNLNFINAFAQADDTLLTAAQSITDIITITGLINRDFNDVDTTLRNGGTAIISTGYGEGQNRVQGAIEDALHSPLLKNTDIFSSKELLMVLYVDKDAENHPFEMDELNQLTQFVNNIVQDVDVMWGLYPIEGLGDKVKITILASGFDITVDGVDESVPGGNDDDHVPDYDPEKKRREEERIAQEYGERAKDTLKKGDGRINVFRPEEMDDDDAISAREKDALSRQKPGASSVQYRKEPDQKAKPAESGKKLFGFDDIE
ncbi:MAG: cell division protein FtsZ [Muribaculaceae bacterium]